jgi:hypothetical protein
VGFAPAGRPKIAIAALVEHGGHGGDVTAPIVMEIVHNYFDNVDPADKDAPHVGLPRRHNHNVELPDATPDGEDEAP